MNRDLEKLLKLEEIDREISRRRGEVTALPRRVAEIEAKLAGVNAAVDKARRALKDIETGRRKYEADIQNLQQKISKYRDQMLSVKTNQEYKALGNEINFAEQEVRIIEDKILEGMLEAEAREHELKAAEVEQKKQQAEVEKEKVQAQALTEEDQRCLSELMPKQEGLRKEISPEWVRHYDRVLKLRGSAMAESHEQMCLACHVQIRAQVFLDVMTSEQVLTCESCGRILYFNPANAVAAEAASHPGAPPAGAAAGTPDSTGPKASVETAAANVPNHS